MKKVMRVLSTLAVTLCLTSGAYAADQKLGKFEVKDGSGAKFTQEGLKGKKSMLAFVQAACGQCRLEVTDIIDKAAAIKAKAELFIVIVDVNSDRALEFFKSQNVPGTLLVDPNFDLGNAAGVSATPSTVIVDKELNIVKAKTGYRPGDLEKLLE